MPRLSKMSKDDPSPFEMISGAINRLDQTIEQTKIVLKGAQALNTELLKIANFIEGRTRREGGVFISYSHADEKIVRVLSERFEKDSINYWLDNKDLLVGEVIDKAISNGIQKSWIFIIILSPTSIKSKWVEREFDEASYEEIEGKKIILPIVVNGLKANKLPPRIRRKLFVDFSTDFEGGYKKLRKSILTYMVEFTQKGKQ